jgi:formate transporter
MMGYLKDAGTYVGDPVMDYVKPQQVVETIIETGASKNELPAGQIVVRGMLGGGLLAFGTSMAFLAVAQGVPSVLAGTLFPTGFIIINLLTLDLITGYFALAPLAFIHRRITFGQLLRAWSWVWFGNLVGSVLYALMIWTALTVTGSAADTTGLSNVLIKAASAKSIHYEPFGMAGMLAALVKGILCNWMVSLGVVLPYAARSVFGKAIATFVPIYMFFSMGWEHMVVNMFIFPSAMLFGGEISMYDFWVANEIPVTIGNFLGGFLFTGAALGWLFYTRNPAEDSVPSLTRPTRAYDAPGR